MNICLKSRNINAIDLNFIKSFIGQLCTEYYQSNVLIKVAIYCQIL